MSKAIAHFSIVAAEDGYVLRIEDEAGETSEFNASYEKLDLIAEAIDDQLDRDAGEVDEVEDAAADD